MCLGIRHVRSSSNLDLMGLLSKLAMASQARFGAWGRIVCGSDRRGILQIVGSYANCLWE